MDGIWIRQSCGRNAIFGDQLEQRLHDYFQGGAVVSVVVYNLDYARNLPLRRVCSGDVPAADPQAVLSFS